MTILFQILSAFVTVLGISQRQKWKMMLFYTINNILCVVMYFCFGRTTTAFISIIATIRTFTFMFYSYKKIKPNIFFLIIFECAFVIITIVTWQDALDLLPLIAMLSAGFGSWQDNHFILRVSYIINNSFYLIYKLIIGAYISMAVEAINLICTITCFVYYCLLKKEKPILQAIFKKKEQISNQENQNNID